MIDLFLSTRLLSLDVEVDMDVFDSLLTDLSDLGSEFGSVMDGFDLNALTSISEAGLGWSWTDTTLGALTLDIIGSGLGPVGTPAAFLGAVLGGTATGTISNVILAVEGAPLADISLGADAISVGLGEYVLAIDGAFPTDLSGMFGVISPLIGLASGIEEGLDDLLGLADGLTDALEGISISGVGLSKGKTDILALRHSATEISLDVAGGLSVIATGSFPGDLLSLGETALDLVLPLLSGGVPDPDGSVLDGLALDDLVVRDARGRLFEVGGDFSEGEFGPVEVRGTGRKDVVDLGFLELLGGDTTTVVSARGGYDKITGTSGRDIISGDAGNDLLKGMAGRDVLKGGTGDDELRGMIGRDQLSGNKGDDMLLGMGGGDVLHGGGGADSIDGGMGNDTLTGAAGHDVFRFLVNAGHDIVTDFANNRDALVLDDRLWGGADLSPRQVVRKFGGLNADGDVELIFDEKTSITFDGIGNRAALVDDMGII